MEQPTIFYPTVIMIAIMGASGFDVLLAWVYVGLRIVHSIWQATVNVVTIRFLIFALSTLDRANSTNLTITTLAVTCTSE